MYFHCKGNPAKGTTVPLMLVTFTVVLIAFKLTFFSFCLFYENVNTSLQASRVELNCSHDLIHTIVIGCNQYLT